MKPKSNVKHSRNFYASKASTSLAALEFTGAILNLDSPFANLNFDRLFCHFEPYAILSDNYSNTDPRVDQLVT